MVNCGPFVLCRSIHGNPPPQCPYIRVHARVSMRGKTHAYHRLEDNVPEETKQRRLREMIEVFQRHARAQNEARWVVVVVVIIINPVFSLTSKCRGCWCWGRGSCRCSRAPARLMVASFPSVSWWLLSCPACDTRIGTVQTVLVEQTSKRSDQEMMGRSDGNIKCILPRFDGARELVPGDYAQVRMLLPLCP